MAIIKVDEVDFQEVLSNEFEKGNIVILKFISEYCDACMALGFELQELNGKYDNVSILEIDCGESGELASIYGVFEVPTMVIYENEDSVLWHQEGVVLAQDIEKIINV
jgi:thioredoxin 1